VVPEKRKVAGLMSELYFMGPAAHCAFNECAFHKRFKHQSPVITQKDGVLIAAYTQTVSTKI
jgi:hypothetical protein